MEVSSFMMQIRGNNSGDSKFPKNIYIILNELLLWLNLDEGKSDLDLDDGLFILSIWKGSRWFILRLLYGVGLDGDSIHWDDKGRL